MSSDYRYFCPMRAVRVYLKKRKYLESVTREGTQAIFIENTLYYIEGKITKRFYSILVKELLQQANYHRIWYPNHDKLANILTIASELVSTKSTEYISQINLHLINFLQKYRKQFSPSISISEGLTRLAYSYTAGYVNF